jgi:hypothetical protein
MLRSKSMRRKPTASYVGAAADQPAGASSAARHVRITMQVLLHLTDPPLLCVFCSKLRCHDQKQAEYATRLTR